MKSLYAGMMAAVMASSFSTATTAAFSDFGMERSTPALIQLAGKARDTSKTTVKTKKDGTIVTREITRSNDGKGNKTVTKTKTTSDGSNSSDSSGGSGGAGVSYEGW